MPRGNRNGISASSKGFGSTRFNPNLIIPWNTVRMGAEEFAMVKWLGDEVVNDELTDISEYHAWRGDVNGKPQFRYVYCSTKNAYTDENGKRRQIVSGDCELCQSTDPTTSRTMTRFNTWVWCYAVYHTQQNPRLNRFDDAVHWEHKKVGARHYYQEKIMKPQLLQMSGRLREAFEAYYDRLGSDFKGTVFDCQKRGTPPNITFHVAPSQIAHPEELDEDIWIIKEELPDIEKVASEQIKEWEFPVLGDSGSSDVEPEEFKDDKEAFSTAGGTF